jgi:hypothetical protein
MTCFSLSGCGTWNCPEPEVIIKTVYHYTPCDVDPVPNYVELNPEKHLGSAENANALIKNVTVMQDYNESLLNTIECYEKQQETTE